MNRRDCRLTNVDCRFDVCHRNRGTNGRLRSLVVACVLVTGSAVSAEVSNRIVAIVNDDIITEGDLRAYLSALLNPEERPSDEELSQVRQAVLYRIIDERLIVQEAMRLGLTVESRDVLSRLQEIQAELQTKAAYEQMLREAGLTEEHLKTKLREQLLVQRAIDQKIRTTIVVSPHELAQAAQTMPATTGDDARVRHLLIRVNSKRSAEEARTLAQQLHERLVRGEAFEALAREHSEDAQAEGGGDLGWVQPGQLLPELDRVVQQLEVGGLSSPIQTRLGFHLISVVERRSPEPGAAAPSRKQLHQQLYQQKFAQAMQAWLEQLRQDAYIEIIQD